MKDEKKYSVGEFEDRRKKQKKSAVNRVILIVLDSLGIGALPDAEKYGDSGADTLGHIIREVPEIKIPHLEELGLFAIDGVSGRNCTMPRGLVGRLSEMSAGKDTITGHWEIAGLYTETPFRTYPDGFPKAFIEQFEKAIGIQTLGNYPASGTEIIEKLGPEHEATGKPIVYTSADSVFQIAANTAILPLERLYEICETARRMLIGETACGRVIARPYILDKDGRRIRTSDRRDYAVSPPADTMLDLLVKAGKTVHAVGKISDIFNGRGISESVHTDNNMDGVDKTLKAMKADFSGLIFTNLVDFDSLYGHRRDPKGYAKAIEEFDERLPELFAALRKDDLLILCADHGNDPVHSGWDHTREYVPLIVFGKVLENRKPDAVRNLGTRSTFADIGATVCQLLKAEAPAIGESFWGEVFHEYD